MAKIKYNNKSNKSNSIKDVKDKSHILGDKKDDYKKTILDKEKFNFSRKGKLGLGTAEKIVEDTITTDDDLGSDTIESVSSKIRRTSHYADKKISKIKDKEALNINGKNKTTTVKNSNRVNAKNVSTTNKHVRNSKKAAKANRAVKDLAQTVRTAQSVVTSTVAVSKTVASAIVGIVGGLGSILPIFIIAIVIAAIIGIFVSTSSTSVNEESYVDITPITITGSIKNNKANLVVEYGDIKLSNITGMVTSSVSGKTFIATSPLSDKENQESKGDYKITYYCPMCNSPPGSYAVSWSGASKAYEGSCAGDPSDFKYGTQIIIPGETVVGKDSYQMIDICGVSVGLGGKKKQKVIDVFVNTPNKCKCSSYGNKTLGVFVGSMYAEIKGVISDDNTVKFTGNISGVEVGAIGTLKDGNVTAYGYAGAGAISAVENGGIYSGGNMVWPCPGSSTISSYFGNRQSPGGVGSTNHKGIDISAAKGTPVVAGAGGTVTYAKFNSGGYGNMVTIDHGKGITTKYAHNSKIIVKKGATVVAGQKIAEVGSTGNSTGNHLHFEINVNGTPVNPLLYLAKG